MSVRWKDIGSDSCIFQVTLKRVGAEAGHIAEDTRRLGAAEMFQPCAHNQTRVSLIVIFVFPAVYS